MPALSELGCPDRYKQLLKSLQSKRSRTSRLWRICSRGVPLARMLLEKRTVAAKLARCVATGDYTPAPAQTKRIRFDKERSIISLAATDFLLHGVVAELMAEALEPILSQRLYSYRKGRSTWQVAGDLARYVRAHRRTYSDPRQRGIYVMRADITSYGDSIPVDNRSLLWEQLRKVLHVDETNFYWDLLQAVVRPVIHNPGYAPLVRTKGIPVGSPIANMLTNLYLDPLDHKLAEDSEGFYARYGDDILFAHPDPRVVREVIGNAEQIVRERGLRFNPEKRQILFFNGAGRTTLDWPSAKPTTCVEYVGCSIDFHGAVGLSRRKFRAVLTDLRARLRRSARLIHHDVVEKRGQLLCQIANNAFDLRSTMHTPYADLLLGVVTDRKQLKQLDYWLARTIVQLVSGVDEVRGFRTISYQRLRRNWGLVSLVHQRNLQSRARGGPDYECTTR